MTTDNLLNLGAGVLWVSPVLLVPALLLLALERRWTRIQRQAGRGAPLAAYLLDAAALVAALAAVLGTVGFLVSVVVLAARWAADVIAGATSALAANPVMLASVVLALAGALLGAAFARGWLPMPRARTLAPAAIGDNARVAPVAPTALAASASAPSMASRLVSAPPSQDEQPATAQRRAGRARPSPVHHTRSRPWMRASTPSETATHTASATPSAERSFEASTGLAMLSARRASGFNAAPARPAGPVYSPSVRSATDDDEAPALAMLNQRRREVYERREEGASSQQVVVPAFHAQAAPKPAPVGPSTSGWWHLPLGVTVVLVVSLVVALVALGRPLSAEMGDLLAFQAAVPGAEQVAAPQLEAGAAPAAAASDAGSEQAAAAQIEPTVAPSQSSTAGVALVAAERLNVRASPGLEQQVVAVTQRGDQLLLLGEEQLIGESVWVRVRAGDVEGWVNRSYIEVQPG